MKNNGASLKRWGWCLAAGVLGVAAVIAPAWDGPSSLGDVWDLYRVGIEKMSMATVVLVVAAGAICGILSEPSEGVMRGACVAIMLPIISVIDSVAQPTSHNLLPLELLVYLVIAVIGVIGAVLGILVKQAAWRVCPFKRRGGPSE